MLRVHFLNVGHGDCTVLGHPSGRLTMIDINNSQDYDPDSFKELEEEERRKTGGGGLGLGALSLGGSALSANAASDLGLGGVGALSGLLAGYAATKLAHDAAAQEIADPIAFMRNTYTRQSLWRFVLTHPDLDHMRGLKNLHETIGFANFWDTDHVKPKPEFKNGSDSEDWEFYQALRRGQVSGVNVFRFVRGSSAFAFARDEYGLPGGDNIEILSPTPALVTTSNEGEKWNDLSIALRVSHGNRSVLLPGDAETAAWQGMTAYYGAKLKSDYLKASHHGRDSGYDLDAVKLIAPRVTFVSVGRKPDTDASSKYRQQCNRVASTRFYGNMELKFHDDGNMEWIVQRNADR